MWGGTYDEFIAKYKGDQIITDYLSPLKKVVDNINKYKDVTKSILASPNYSFIGNKDDWSGGSKGNYSDVKMYFVLNNKDPEVVF